MHFLGERAHSLWAANCFNLTCQLSLKYLDPCTHFSTYISNKQVLLQPIIFHFSPQCAVSCRKLTGFSFDFKENKICFASCNKSLNWWWNLFQNKLFILKESLFSCSIYTYTFCSCTFTKKPFKVQQVNLSSFSLSLMQTPLL